MVITRIQGPAKGSSQINSITVNIGSAPANGNILVAVVGAWGAVRPQVTGITQNNVTWAYCYKNIDRAGMSIEVWLGTVSVAAGTAVTVSLDNNATALAVANICEYSGLVSSPKDNTAKANSAGTPTSTGTTVNTSQAEELWVGGVLSASWNQDQSAPTNGFTLLDGVRVFGAGSVAYLEKIVSSVGTANSGTTHQATGYSAFIVTLKAKTTIPTPTMSPVGGVYAAIQNVTISDTQGTALIYYTNDGSIPDATKSLYGAPIVVASAKTLKAIALETDYLDSAIATEIYVINLPPTSGEIPQGPPYAVRRRKELLGLMRDYLVMKGRN
jgi:hypothetical protein